MAKYKTLERFLQLHEVLEVHYLVDCYEAQLYMQDHQRKVAIGRGNNIIEAITNLSFHLVEMNYTLEAVRQLPPLEK